MKVRDDRLLQVGPLLEKVGDRGEFLWVQVQAQATEKLPLCERTGRPPGTDGFVAALQRRLKHVLRPHKPGRKPTGDAK